MATIKLTRFSDQAARLTLARPDRRNAVNAEMAAEFCEAVETIESWGLQIAILDAEGPAFSAGADLSDLEAASRALDSMVETLLSARVYWTAAVEGAVRGGSLGLLAACPRVLATPLASFGLPELARGFFPVDVVIPQVGLIGARHAFDLAFRPEAIDAHHALAAGLVSEVLSVGELEAKLEDETLCMATLDPDALRVGIGLWQEHQRRRMVAGAG